VVQDKIDESEDKESILGADILNPTTGVHCTSAAVVVDVSTDSTACTLAPSACNWAFQLKSQLCLQR
jgi:hypothetical protein